MLGADIICKLCRRRSLTVAIKAFSQFTQLRVFLNLSFVLREVYSLFPLQELYN